MSVPRFHWIRIRCVLGLLVLVPPCTAFAEIEIPLFESLVTDKTTTLSAGKQAVLESGLRAFEARKGSQIAVLIVPTTRPETIEQYAIRVVEQWKPGRKNVDDGVLLLLAKDDRRVRIEVGYGLEGTLTDATAEQIIKEEIVPRFRRNDFIGGITAGVGRIMRVIDGEPLPPTRSQSFESSIRQSESTTHPDVALAGAVAVGVGLIGAVVLLIVAGALGASGTGIAASVPVGLVAGTVAGAATSALVGVGFGIIAAIVTIVLNRKAGFVRGVGDSGGSWSFGGASSHNGGFSGGGGGLFGGGGASGDWGGGGGGGDGGGGE